jgi:hypothetical protein
MDKRWATRGLTFLIDNPHDADVIMGERVVEGWVRHQGTSGADRESYVAGFGYALALVGVAVASERLHAALERGQG